MPSLDQLIVWVIVGLLGGSLAGLIIKWERKGFGIFRNLALGLIGALHRPAGDGLDEWNCGTSSTSAKSRRS